MPPYSVFVILLITAHCNLRYVESQMRTLYKGPVQPPGEGAKFNMGHWLKSAIPAPKDRCKVPCYALAVTALYNDYPENGQFKSALKYLEFTVRTTEYVRMGLRDVAGTVIYYIMLYPTLNNRGLIRHMPTLSDSTGDELGAFAGAFAGTDHIWITHTDNEIQVGLGGRTGAVMRMFNVSVFTDIWSIEFYFHAGSAELKIYSPCD